jgi:hypothetical protein
MTPRTFVAVAAVRNDAPPRYRKEAGHRSAKGRIVLSYLKFSARTGRRWTGFGGV